MTESFPSSTSAVASSSDRQKLAECVNKAGLEPLEDPIRLKIADDERPIDAVVQMPFERRTQHSIGTTRRPSAMADGNNAPAVAAETQRPPTSTRDYATISFTPSTGEKRS